MATKVFGIRIYLDDHASPVTGDANIGLYNVTSNAASDAAASQKDVVVADGSIFTAGELVTISDSVASETNRVSSIVSNTLTMVNNLANTYTTANSAKVDANSRFRWVQNAISGVTTWKEGVIAAGGIRAYTREIDLSRGGDIASPGSSEVVIKNTNQFFDTIYDKEIYLNGLKCEIVLFTDDAPVVQWTGICGSPSWTAKEYTIPLSGYYTKRVANIGTLITKSAFPNADKAIDKVIPVTFGKFIYDSATKNLAKFIRVSDKKTRQWNNFWQDANGNTVFWPAAASIFPVVYPVESSTATLTYRIMLGSRFATPTSYPNLVGMYVHVVDGDGEGEYRRIASFTNITSGVEVVIDNYFTTTLQGNGTATAPRQTWVELIEIQRDYYSDIWPCRSFLNIFNEEITTQLQLFSYTDDKIFRLSEYAIKIAAGANNNILDLDVTMFGSNIDTVDCGIIIKPVTNFARANGQISDWFAPTEKDGNDDTYVSYSKKENGIWKANSTPQRTAESTFPASTVVDKIIESYDTYGESWDLANGYSDGGAVLLFDFDFPDPPDDFEFDEVYYLAKIHFQASCDSKHINQCRLFFRHRRFTSYPLAGDDVGLTHIPNYVWSMWFECIPDFYSADGTGKNEAYFISTATTDTKQGFVNFKIADIDNMEKYLSMHKGCLGFTVAFSDADTAHVTALVFEIAMMFKKSISISDAVYSPFSGRIYNDTWGSGRGIVSADLMTAPHRILEHVCRLQNWSENSIVPTSGWGKGYADNALIKTTGTGSFDDTADDYYVAIKDMHCAAQFMSEADTYTDKLKRSLCRDFFLANWVDKNGYECVARIRRNNTTIADADKLTLADIVDRQSIKIIDPEPSDIYPEPFVRYNYNQASGEYDSAIRIFNVSGTWATTNVEGLTGSEAQEYWNRCVRLWQRSHAINKPPSDLTDLTWANGEQADAIAKKYLTCWIDWMYNPSIVFKTTFAKAGAWEECKRFSINLPHQTNAVAIECMLTEIAVDPNPPYYVTIKAIMFSETIPEDFNIKKTWDAFGTDDGDWVKTHTAYGNDNDIIKVH